MIHPVLILIPPVIPVISLFICFAIRPQLRNNFTAHMSSMMYISAIISLLINSFIQNILFPELVIASIIYLTAGFILEKILNPKSKDGINSFVRELAEHNKIKKEDIKQ